MISDRLYMILMALLSVIIVVLIILFRDRADDLVSLMGSFSGSPMAIGVAVLVFFIGSILLIPQWLLIGTAVAAFGLVEGNITTDNDFGVSSWSRVPKVYLYPCSSSSQHLRYIGGR